MFQIQGPPKDGPLTPIESTPDPPFLWISINWSQSLSQTGVYFPMGIILYAVAFFEEQYWGLRVVGDFIPQLLFGFLSRPFFLLLLLFCDYLKEFAILL